MLDPQSNPQDDNAGSKYPSRRDLIEHLSWCEDMQRGRWGVEYATAVLEHYEDQAVVNAAYQGENECADGGA